MEWRKRVDRDFDKGDYFSPHMVYLMTLGSVCAGIKLGY